MRTVLLAHEQEGPALVAGAWLGGERAALLMQSSAGPATPSPRFR